MDTNYFAQRIQCSRNDKEEALRTVVELAEIAFASQGGIRALDEIVEQCRENHANRFLSKAIQLYMDAKDAEQIRQILHNTIIASNLIGPQFLQAVIITETMAALFEKENIDFIFTFLVPSFFGMDYENSAVEAYNVCKKRRLMGLGQDEDGK